LALSLARCARRRHSFAEHGTFILFYLLTDR
jgi:hypothetical protein